MSIAKRLNHLELGISPIMQFRFAYLRAIADAWEDEDSSIPGGGGEEFQSLVWKEENTDEYNNYSKQLEWDVLNTKKSGKIMRHFPIRNTMGCYYQYYLA